MRYAFWVLWPLAAVAVPPLVLMFFIANGGWGALAALIYGIVWIPLAIVTALIPWFILRFKRYRETPPVMAMVLMALHWLAFLLIPATSADQSDQGEIPAPLASVVGTEGAEVLLVVAVYTMLASLVAAIIWCSCVPSRRHRGDGTGSLVPGQGASLEELGAAEGLVEHHQHAQDQDRDAQDEDHPDPTDLRT